MSEDTIQETGNDDGNVDLGSKEDGTKPEEKTYNEKELKSELDRRISQAYESIKTKAKEDLKQERKLESSKLENDKLVTDRKYKELWEREQAEKDIALSKLSLIEREQKVAHMLKEEGMMKYFDLLKDSDPEVAKSKLETLKEITSEFVKETVESKISHKVPSPSAKMKQSDVSSMSTEEYIAWKKENRIT